MNNKIIKASFQKCVASDRKLFNKSTCIMPISIGIGLDIHEGSKFLATINLISLSFKECAILIDDTIQRYTKQISNQHLGLEELKKIMIAEGDNWLERNKHIYEQLTIPYKILRWDDWHKHADYHFSCEKVEELYQTDESYRQIVHDNIKKFLERHTAYMNIKEYDYKTAFNNCLLYLKEECSVMCLWAAEKYDFEVYPSGRNRAMEATYVRLIKPYNPNLLKSVGIRFKKY
jgi:hypothetical protein